MVMYAYSDDPDRGHSRTTRTYSRVKDHFSRLKTFESEPLAHRRFVDKLTNQNAAMRRIYTPYNASHLAQDGVLNANLKTQMIDLFGVDVDADKIDALVDKKVSPEELDKRLKATTTHLLKQSFDKNSLLETLFRIVRLIMISNLSFEKKFHHLQSIYQDIADGRRGINTAFSLLSLENSYARTKNGYAPHAILGVFTSVGVIVGLGCVTDALQEVGQVGLAAVQISSTTAGDVVAGQSNQNIFHSPRGNTKSYQHAMLLIKNMLIALAAIYNEKLGANNEIHTKLEEILNIKTARINTSSRWDFCSDKDTMSFKAYAGLGLARTIEATA
jgi:hypothetical protein